MRITGGTLKGRHVDVPGGRMAIRPAMDKMRESVFAILEPELPGRSFLDLFSGSGVIAIEAASHGAAQVSLCEMDRAKARTILRNVTLAEEAGVRVRCHFMAVELFLRRCKEPFDYIFLDPPFPYRFRLDLLDVISRRALVAPGGAALIHHPAESPLPEAVGGLIRADQRAYGRSVVDFFRNPVEKNSETP